MSLNHDTLWTGYPERDQLREGAREALARAKTAVLEGDRVGATKELSKGFGSGISAAYMPLGDLLVTFTAGEGRVSGYRRTLDLSRAVADVCYRQNGVRFTATAFASHPDDALVYRIEAMGEDGAPAPALSLSVGFRSQLYAKVYTEGELLYLEGECPVTEIQSIGNTTRRQQYFDEPEKRGVRFLAVADIRTDGKTSNRMNSILVKEAGFCEIRVSIATSFNGYDNHPFTEGRDYRSDCRAKQAALCEKSYEALLTAHVKDHKRLFDRVRLDLGSDRRAAVPTAERLRRFERGESDRALPALLFNFGRYLTIAASRPGSEATNLQGIWNERYVAPWQSNYTTNINIEMNYFPTLAVGLEELYEPLVRLIRELSEAGRETARQLYGAEGWCCHHNTDLWRFTLPVCGPARYSFWNMAGGWLCRHLFEYYEYTLDLKFLKKTAYPILREAVRFYLSQLVTLDGYRVLLPSTSPENDFLVDGAVASVSETTEMTMAILRELFGNYLETCALLGVTDDITETVRAELPRLLPTRVASDGRVMEWYREERERDPLHRHVSHLYAFYPAHEHRPENAPELCDACRKSLAAKGEETVGWSLAWRACLSAALRNGETAYTYLRNQLRPSTATEICHAGGGGSYANLFGACPPFQIDSNFGITAAMVEMLLQSDMDTVHILPACPAVWQDIDLRGLRAKGGRRVSLTLSGGALAECEIEGSRPLRILFAGEDVTDRFTYDGKRCRLQV
ncbi:MAG: glycoside hydrolase family 95 protein [Ruminococcaceae bacterium]|nr:glycoside hydrolase family 95 protein [Oscillospiraceae bacterium]